MFMYDSSHRSAIIYDFSISKLNILRVGSTLIIYLGDRKRWIRMIRRELLLRRRHRLDVLHGRGEALEWTQMKRSVSLIKKMLSLTIFEFAIGDYVRH